MARLLLLVALCVLPAVVMAVRPYKAEKNPLVLRGRVYCDTCRAGFETRASTYIAGAVVKVQCLARKTMKEVFKAEAVTDKDGFYEFYVHEDHKDQLCDVFLVNSPQPNCAKFSAGRERSRVILTSDNGLASHNRHANNMGFDKDEPDAVCEEVLKQYREFDEED